MSYSVPATTISCQTVLLVSCGVLATTSSHQKAFSATDGDRQLLSVAKRLSSDLQRASNHYQLSKGFTCVLQCASNHHQLPEGFASI